ncbi:MAG: hypothetical protein ACKO9Q_23925, partial [Pirellula sp.]
MTKDMALPSSQKEGTLGDEDRSTNEPYEILKLDGIPPRLSFSTDRGVGLWTLGVELIERGENGQERTIAQNRWDLWQVDKPKESKDPSKLEKSLSTLYLHESCSDQHVSQIKCLANVLGRDVSELRQIQAFDPKGICIAQRIDESILGYLEQGGLVLLIPDGHPHGDDPRGERGPATRMARSGRHIWQPGVCHQFRYALKTTTVQ